MFTLITAANSSAAYKLKNTLAGKDVLMGDYLDLPEVLVKAGKVIQLPDPTHASYAHQMLTLCLNKNISKIYALRKEEFDALLNTKQLFSEYGIDILAADDKI
ncbi:MAG: hypothetical protein ACTHJ8_17185 [Mucilaginibacter sp.]